MLPSDESRIATALARRRTVGAVMAAVMCLVGLSGIVAGEFKAAIVPLAMGLWMAWRTAMLVPEVIENLQERERSEWRDVATGPALQCPRCSWVSYNTNVTHCAECGALLESVPARNLS